MYTLYIHIAAIGARAKIMKIDIAMRAAAFSFEKQTNARPTFAVSALIRIGRVAGS